MKLEELQEKIKVIEQEATAKKQVAYKECALSNNKVKVGDVIEDQIGLVLVQKIMVAFTYGDKMPTCVYRGVSLKKDGKPRKDEEVRGAWQVNLIK